MLDIALVGDEDRSKEKCRRRGLIGLVVVLLALSITFFALLVSNHVLLEKDEAPAPAKNDPAKHPGGIPDPVDPNPNPVNPVSTARAQRRAQLAVKIAASMDATAEPCDDFYQYVCGNYVKEHPIPNTQGGISSFSILGDSNEEFLKATFEDDSKLTGDAGKKALTYYKQCMDNAARDKEGVKGASDFIEKLLKAKDVTSLMVMAVNANLSPFFGIGVGQNAKDATTMAMQISQAGLTLPRADYLSEDKSKVAVQTAYKKFQNDVWSTVQSESKVFKVSTSAYGIEKALAEMHLPAAALRDPEETYNKISVADLQKNYNGSSKAFPKGCFDWTAFVDGLYPTASALAKDFIIVENLDYLNSAVQFMCSKQLYSAKGQTLYTDLQFYVAWQYLASQTGHLTTEVRGLAENFNLLLSGAKQPPPQWKTCVGATVNGAGLGFAITPAFVAARFPDGSVEKGKTLVEGIKAAFTKNLPDVPWLDEPTRKTAAFKAAAIKPFIGFPDFAGDGDQLDAHYADMNIKAKNSFFENAAAARSFSVLHQASLLNAAFKPEWGMYPTTVNAYYQPTENNIYFPSGIMQPPFFDLASPDAANYGAMGSVVGHELTHGFDDQGSQFDYEGNLKPWMDAKSKAGFKEHAQCIEEQYSEYTVDGPDKLVLHVNGTLTEGENIADNGGVRESFVAFHAARAEQLKKLDKAVAKANAEAAAVLKAKPASQKDLEEANAAVVAALATKAAFKSEMATPLPGLNFNDDKLFFVSFARLWCGANTLETAENRALTDPHSPGRYRTIGPLSNDVNFAKAFQCKKGDKMVSEKPCVVW